MAGHEDHEDPFFHAIQKNQQDHRSHSGARFESGKMIRRLLLMATERIFRI